MHSLLRIANIFNAKHKKIKRLTRNSITLQDCNNKKINKSKSKTLSRSITSKI